MRRAGPFILVVLLVALPIAAALGTAELTPAVVDPSIGQPTPAATHDPQPEGRAGSRAQIPPDPFLNLLAEAAPAVAQGDATTTAAAFGQYLSALGLAPPPEEPHGANDSLSYSYTLGDVDLDGVTDYAIDQFCVVPANCVSRAPYDRVAILMRAEQQKCEPHRLAAYSGKNASLLWSWDYKVYASDPVLAIGLSQRVLGCRELIIGRIPWSDGTTGFLVYRFHAVVVPGEALLHHYFYALTPQGGLAWSHKIVGRITGVPLDIVPTVLNPVNGDIYIVDNPSFLVQGENISILPYLQGGAWPGHAWMPNATVSLHLRHVGVAMAIVTTDTLICRIQQGVPGCNPGLRPAPPGSSRPWDVLDSIQSTEYLSRLDPTQGRVLWTRLTFDGKPGEARSRYVQVPKTEQAPPRPAAAMLADPSGVLHFDAPGYYYWFGGPTCCGDLDGDAVPDVLYHVIEWNAYPLYHWAPPEGVDEHVVAVRGEDGVRIYDVTVSFAGTSGAERLPQTVGDLDGDGLSDVLVHQIELNDQDAWHNLTALRGKDGTELWTRAHPRLVLVLPVGGAGNGTGNLLAIFEVFPRLWDLTNVTHSHVTVVHGEDGREAWKDRTVMAYIDLLSNYLTWRFNGLPDFDRDGLGDLLLDEPVVLGDLTYVHRWRAASGRDGHALLSFDSAGQVSFPARVDDLTGDGRDDLCLLTGDFLDIWLTCRDGVTAEPTWSRRFMAPKIGGHVMLLPRLRLDPITDPSTARRDLLANLHLTAISAAAGGASTFTGFTNNQIALLRASNGSAGWSFPELWGPLLNERPGDAPANDQFYVRFEAPPPTAIEAAGSNLSKAAMPLAALVVPFALIQFVSRRRRK